MRNLRAILCLLLSGCAKTSPTLAIRDVTVVDVMDGVLRPEQTVLITGNRIVAVGPTDRVRIPGDADLIEAAGGYLIPGLWDMHVHSVANVALDMPVGSVTNADWHFPLFLAYGVTGVRNMNDGSADPTLELTNSVKRRLAEGDLLGPRLLANGPAVDGDPPLVSNPAVVRTAMEARAVVDKLADHGADFIKVYENLSPEAYFAIMDQARRRGIPVDGHVPFRVRPAEAADAGQRTFEHVLAMALGCSTEADAEREAFARVLSDPSRPKQIEQPPLALFRHERRLYQRRQPAACAETVDAYRRNGVAEAPSLVGYHHVVNAKEILADTQAMRLVPPAIFRNWEAWLSSESGLTVRSILSPLVPLQAENARLLNEAGVLLLAATDVGIPTLVPGLSLHEELVLLGEAGLTPLEVLRTATVNPARVLGLADSLGTIEAGKLADLLLLDADPLVDISNTRRIRAVVADGRLFRRADLDRLLAEVDSVAAKGDKPGSREVQMGKGRLEAFSDGVLAIIITIMVLELRPPHDTDLAALRPLLPVLLSYVLSFIFLGIYWNNHHHMLSCTRRVTGAILWANLHLLFWLSLVPFVTAWMGEHPLAAAPAALYGVVLLLAGMAYLILQRQILRSEGPDSILATVLGRDLKGKLSPLLCALAIGMAFVHPGIAYALYMLVAFLWLIPDRRIERALAQPQAGG